MAHPRRTFLRAAASLMATSVLPAWAAGYPDKPVKIVVGFAAGGGADIVARQVGARLGEQTGQQFIVDNRPGATGTIAANGVAKSSADGYTLMLASQSTMVVAPNLYPKLGFNPVKDFTPVSMLVSMPLVLVVHPSVQAKTLQEFIALVRREKAGLPYASSGAGGPQHVAGELFSYQARLNLTHVPYKGEAPAVTDVIGGQVQMMFANLPAVAQHLASGRLRALAISSTKRHPALPELPTVAEAAGLPDFEVLTWYGLFAPAGTPAAVTRKLQDETLAALKNKDLAAKLDEQGFSVAGSTTEQFTGFVKTEVPRWARLIKEANIQAE